ncbi:MAG TPA: type III-A CRISPR-associated RAMP protein Csm3 [Bacilli bacterium]|nr:type III-A CRISPR-associated RAMP protein Csm3 [Bacilli bacterium]
MNDIRLTKRCVCEIELQVLTGIHIGGSKEIYGIGGIDNPVIKNPLTGEPIIPGSSLKGKIRSLLELTKNDMKKLFDTDQNGPTRVIFRDLCLSKQSVNMLTEMLGFGIFTEVKAENSIDKRTGKAANPRFSERVPAGVTFEGEIIVNAYNNENIEEMIAVLKKGFELLKANYLGGSGTRGYGKVEIAIKKESMI